MKKNEEKKVIISEARFDLGIKTINEAYFPRVRYNEDQLKMANASIRYMKDKIGLALGYLDNTLPLPIEKKKE